MGGDDSCRRCRGSPSDLLVGMNRQSGRAHHESDTASDVRALILCTEKRPSGRLEPQQKRGVLDPKKHPRTALNCVERVLTFPPPALKALWNKDGGRGGSRTHGKVAPTSDFESGALNHSATLPYVEVRRSSFAESEVYIDGWRFCKLQSVWRVQLYLYRAGPDR